MKQIFFLKEHLEGRQIFDVVLIANEMDKVKKSRKKKKWLRE